MDNSRENKSRAIPRRRLGRTGLMITCLGLGGMGVMNRCHSQESAVEVVTTAIDMGINFIDTARGYFDSEKIIGQALTERPGKAYITTKTYMRSASGASKEIETSLRTLQQKKIPLIQIHHLQYKEEFERITAPGGAMEAIRSFQKQGLIDHVGVSTHNPRIICEILQSDLFDTVQIPFSPVERDHFEKIREVARQRDIGIIAMKPLSGGHIKSVEEALGFILSHREVSTVIPGCSTTDEVCRDVEAVLNLGEITDEHRRDIIQQLREIPDQFCRRCRYCEHRCPENIPIADIFRCENYLILSATYARQEHRKLPRHFNQCRDCGECEKICPYHLPVRKMLRQAEIRLRRGWLEDAGVTLLRKIGLYDLGRRVYFALGGKIPDRFALKENEDDSPRNSKDKQQEGL